jgi:hypothetical protein
MATNFPTSLDTFTNPNSGNTLDSPSHSIQHSDINDAVEAIEAKIGIGSSTAGSATAGYALVNTSGGTTAYSLLGVTGLSSGTAVANTVLTANGSGAATFAPTAQGLTLLNTTSFNAQSSVTLANNTFSATYLHYKIIVSLTSATLQSTLALRVTNSGTPVTSGAYDRNNIYLASNNGAVWTNDSSGDNQTSILMGAYTTGGGAISFEVLYPFETENTLITGTNFTSTSGFYVSGGRVDNTTSYDALQFFGSGGGDLTGSYSVYGFNR